METFVENEEFSVHMLKIIMHGITSSLAKE